MQYPLRPLIFAADLLSADTRSAIQDAFENTNPDLCAIQMHFWFGKREFVPKAPNDFFFRDGERARYRTWRNVSLPSDQSARLANAVMHIADERDLPDQVLELVRECDVADPDNYVTLTVLESCAVLSHGDLDGYVAACARQGDREESIVSCRSSVATVLVPEVPSNHERLQLEERLRDGIEHYKRIHKSLFDRLEEDHGIILTDPQFEGDTVE